ncbi:hypothetical protein JW872_00905 [Candidatus Babeliales bacterium]|nr:hypothetical protein [Candidatus Babeliales bacterium]
MQKKETTMIICMACSLELSSLDAACECRSKQLSDDQKITFIPAREMYDSISH